MADEAGVVDDPASQQQEQNQGEQPVAKTYTQADVDRITAKVRENARRDGELTARRQLQPQAQREERKVEEQPKAPEPPKREAYESYEDYVLAKADFTARTATREEREKYEKQDREQKIADQRQKTGRDFAERARKTVVEIPDFAEVIQSADGVLIKEAMAEAIQESEIGPRILYELAKNPEEAARIAALSPSGQAREIGKLEARIEAQIKSSEKGDEKDDDESGDDPARQSEKDKGERNADGTFKSTQPRKAPDPIEPTGGRSATNNRGPSDKDDMKEWVRKRNAELAAEGKARRGG